MDGEKQALEVAAGVIWKEGRFLAARRPAGKPRAGFWEFPGGKVESGESVEQALARELFEELGIVPLGAALLAHVCHSYPDLRVRVHFLQVSRFQGEPAARDGQELRWVTPEEARALDFLPADLDVVRDLQPPREKKE